jgi:hypothetical protein
VAHRFWTGTKSASNQDPHVGVAHSQLDVRVAGVQPARLNGAGHSWTVDVMRYRPWPRLDDIECRARRRSVDGARITFGAQLSVQDHAAEQVGDGKKDVRVGCTSWFDPGSTRSRRTYKRNMVRARGEAAGAARRSHHPGPCSHRNKVGEVS